jgi:hypothetical protein
VIAGTLIEDYFDGDLQYMRDLGLISLKGIEIANPIYKEILPRALTYFRQEALPLKTSWYLNDNGSLNMHRLLEGFQQFYRENSAIWLEKFEYKEAGPHLILMAWLQRIINACPEPVPSKVEGLSRRGGGKIHREYALGRQRVDLRIDWKQQHIVVELKINRSEKTVIEGLEQTAQYMDTANATEGHLVMFDPSKKSWDEKIYREQRQEAGKTIEVWGC